MATNDKQSVPLNPRVIADGLKLALKELAKEEPETLRAFLMAIWEHMSDGASKWAGRRILALLAGALFTLALWIIGFKGWPK